ncbi:hypothetical protein L1987_64864 [Smallanthus sonchifolius]|uniref:Uncharacterized protein n=1 Tax=Smallanthus sonchifolius TaxID=185202 RepID=A0ACB9BST0_9ASTR|nr:hypothetical protein L1987_64864 [Smallanthus sonchifolius]
MASEGFTVKNAAALSGPPRDLVSASIDNDLRMSFSHQKSYVVIMVQDRPKALQDLLVEDACKIWTYGKRLIERHNCFAKSTLTTRCVCSEIRFSIKQLLVRKAKNTYHWRGLGSIPKALEQLQEECFRNNDEHIDVKSGKVSAEKNMRESPTIVLPYRTK